MLIALATLIYSGAWMFAAPAKALSLVNKVSNEVRRFDRNIFWQGMEPMPETIPVRVAFRFVGLGLIVLSLIRLTQL